MLSVLSEFVGYEREVVSLAGDVGGEVGRDEGEHGVVRMPALRIVAVGTVGNVPEAWREVVAGVVGAERFDTAGAAGIAEGGEPVVVARHGVVHAAQPLAAFAIGAVVGPDAA